ncbi:MAG: response regulator [Lachnospiraceae bacterium]|nr:response regulator [Lachnospiraceae bacterium]
MFHILICDDEPVTCTFIEDVLSGYAQKNGISMNIEIFYTGEGLCEYVDRKSGVDLLFLDIELPDVNGAEIGKTLRENIGNETIQIIFISGKERYAMQLFKARPFDFLIKPLNANMVIDVFENYRKVYKQFRSYFEYKIGKSTELPLSSSNFMIFSANIILSNLLLNACEAIKKVRRKKDDGGKGGRLYDCFVTTLV